MQKVPLHGKVAAGRFALVDDEDYDMVMQRRWFVREIEQPEGCRPLGPYAWTYVPALGDQKRGSIAMHNLIMGTVGIDHVNHNGLDNRRENLRAATQGENVGNSRKRAGVSSQYKGVSWIKRKKRWGAAIGAAGRPRGLGSYVDEADAARAYDAAAREAYGEFACVNFPGPGERGALDPAGGEDMTSAALTAAGPFVTDGCGKSRYRGVLWAADSQQWRARFRRTYGGQYKSEIRAAIAYDVLALAALGDAAQLNFPDGVDELTAERLLAETGVTVEAARAAVGRGRSATLRAMASEREAVNLVCEQCSSEYQHRGTNERLFCSIKCQRQAGYERNRNAGRIHASRERTEQAARIYSELAAAGSPPTITAMAEVLDCHRSYAWRMIHDARELGLLGAVEP